MRKSNAPSSTSRSSLFFSFSILLSLSSFFTFSLSQFLPLSPFFDRSRWRRLVPRLVLFSFLSFSLFFSFILSREEVVVPLSERATTTTSHLHRHLARGRSPPVIHGVSHGDNYHWIRETRRGRLTSILKQFVEYIVILYETWQSKKKQYAGIKEKIYMYKNI